MTDHTAAEADTLAAIRESGGDIDDDGSMRVKELLRQLPPGTTRERLAAAYTQEAEEVSDDGGPGMGTTADIGWWSLTITGVTELNDADREHIAALILEGFTSGQIVQENNE